MEAKDELLSIIEQRFEEKVSDFLTQFSQEVSSNGIMDLATMKNHVLVFICALIPKVFKLKLQCPPLNRITLGQHKSDNINQ